MNAEERYLELLIKCLTRYGFDTGLRPIAPENPMKARLWGTAGSLIGRLGLELSRRAPFDPRLRATGRDYPPDAETMVGLERLNNLRECAATVIEDGIPGDFIETGVWRGGACILLRGVLAARGVTDRTVWVADSFEGLPPPSGNYQADVGDTHHEIDLLAVTREEVEENFRRYGLLDDQVKFLEGWFSETLPDAPIERLSVLRLDGDMYESTICALTVLYPKLSPGGYIIIDDFGNENTPGCTAAVRDYRSEHAITDDIEDIDWTGAFWRKSA